MSSLFELNRNRIIYPGVVLDNNDPLIIGRVRIRPTTRNFNDIIKSYYPDQSANLPDDIPKKYWWTKDDPFVFLSLLPYFFRQIPKVGEYVNLIYSNPRFMEENKFYVQGPITSPVFQYNEKYQNAEQLTSTGDRIKSAPDIKDINGNYINERYNTVFPEPNDIAILGRLNTDIILKDNDVLIRAGKSNAGELIGSPPVYNKNRSFVQLSNFLTSSQNRTVNDIFKVKKKQLPLKYLVEWDILNPDSNGNFSGSVFVYRIREGANILSSLMSVDYEVSDELKSFAYVENFQNLTKEQTYVFINDFLKNFKTGELTNAPQFGDIFPFYYRPTKNILDKSKISSNFVQTINILEFMGNIGLSLSEKEGKGFGGYGLIFSRDKKGSPLDIVKTQQTSFDSTTNNKTVGFMGSDELYLLSHKSRIPGKGAINLDNTNYGITSVDLDEKIKPQTSSVVRGEELLELLELIVEFMVTHVHPFPGMPTVPTTVSGRTTAELTKKMLEAYEKILNKNIRIN